MEMLKLNSMECVECFECFALNAFVFVKINLILNLQSWGIMPIYFPKLILTRFFSSAFLLFNQI